MDLIKNKEETQYFEQKSYYYGSQKTIISKLISEEKFNNSNISSAYDGMQFVNVTVAE